MSFIKLFKNPSTSQGHFCNFGFKVETVTLMELFIKTVDGIDGKYKKKKKNSEKTHFAIVKFQSQGIVPIKQVFLGYRK